MVVLQQLTAGTAGGGVRMVMAVRMVVGVRLAEAEGVEELAAGRAAAVAIVAGAPARGGEGACAA